MNASAPPPLGGILETVLYVADLHRATAFYEGVFGFRRVAGDDKRFSALAVADRQLLLLFLRSSATEPLSTPGGTIPPHDGIGELHLAFAVAAEALPEWERRLEAHGVEIESRVSWPRGGQSIYFRDPDRNAVELATPGLWSTY